MSLLSANGTSASDPRSIGNFGQSNVFETVNVNLIQTKSTGNVTIINAVLNGSILGSVLGAPNGLATLNAQGLVPGSQISATFLDSAFTIENAVVTTKQTVFSLVGQTAGTKLTLATSNTANRVLTFPDVTDTFAMLAATQALTNKTITDASNSVTADTLRVAFSIQAVIGTQAVDSGSITTLSIWTGTVLTNVGGITTDGQSFYLPVAGLYHVSVDSVGFPTNSTGYRQIWILDVGSARQSINIQNTPSATSPEILPVSGYIYSTGPPDRIIVQVLQSSGGVLNVGAVNSGPDGTILPVLTIVRVA